MKNNSSKNVKRAISPLISKTNQISQRKKKSLSHSNNPYAKVIKQFQTYTKPQQSNKKDYINTKFKDSLNQRQKDIYRILTQPVEDHKMHLGKVNIFNSSYGKVPPSRKKIQKQIPQPPVKFNLRSSNRSKQKLHTQQSQHHYQCKNCLKYIQQNQFLRTQMNKIFMTKSLWKAGQITLSECKNDFEIQISGGINKGGLKSIQGLINQTKKHMLDLMKDIQSLSSIDYPKMLSLQIFNYQGSYDSCSDHQYAQIKSLIGQLRSGMQGKVTSNDLDDLQNDSRMRSMIRNLKSRLNYVLRQNIQLKMNKAVLNKADQLSSQSEDYLKKIIQDVLTSYTIKHKY